MSAITTEQRFFYEIMKMRSWCPRPWLIVTGSLFSVNGRAVVGRVTNKKLKDGTATATLTGRPGLSYASVDGALDAWQYYGGYYKFLTNGNDLLTWIRRHERMLATINAGEATELSPRSVQRELLDPTPIAWLAGLFDGIGRKTAKIVFGRVTNLAGRMPTLLDAISYVTNYQASEIPGITKERVSQWRQHLGLKNYAETKTLPATYETISTHQRIEDSGEIYWRSPSTRWDYRKFGRREEGEFFTLSVFETLLTYTLSITLPTAVGGSKVKIGRALRCEMGPKFDWLILNCEGVEERLRIDKIVDVDLLEG
jgi:hypothetical protein